MENQILKRFTMNVDHTNPDAKVTFTSVGTGKTDKEAAVFALATFYKFMDGEEEDQVIQNYEDALKIVNEKLEYEGIDTVINSLINGSVEKNSDIFYNAYEHTEVDYGFTEIENATEGGYIPNSVVIVPEY